MSAPRLARLLIRLTAPRNRRDDALGDLEEAHAARRPRGAVSAWFATTFEALVIAATWCVSRLRNNRQPHQRSPLLGMMDLRLGFRLLVRQPLLAITSIVALTVGIGLANIGFASMEALMFSRLPFEGGERFVRLNTVTALTREPAALAPDSFPTLLTQLTSLSHVGIATGGRESVVRASGVVDDVVMAGITPDSLPYLQSPPLRGRWFTKDDSVAGRNAVVLISETYWRRNMDAAESAIGGQITLQNAPHTIVGIMPAAFKFPNSPAIWTPVGVLSDDARVFGVMAPGETLESVATQLAAVSPRLRTANGTDGLAVEAIAFTDLGPAAPMLSAVLIVMALAVLVVIAANVGNLVLARSFARSREFALRAALGASRGRLVMQVMIEVMVLGTISAVLGILMARAALLRLNQMDELPFWINFSGGVLSMVMVAATTILAAAIAGAWPALRATRRDVMSGLQGGDGRTSDVRFGRTAGAMLITQIAVSVVMLHGALVVAQGFRHYTVGAMSLPTNVLVMGLDVTAPGAIATDEAERLAAALPGVMAAGASTSLPRHSPSARLVEVEPVAGELPTPARLAPSAAVSPGFFSALNTSAQLGRLLQAADTVPGAPRVVVVNAPFARAWFGQTSPLGRRLRVTGAEGPGPWMDIVGVVPDLGLSVGDPSLAAGYYVPLGDDAEVVYLALRVNGDPMSYAQPLRETLRKTHPDLVAYRPERLEDVAAEDRLFFRVLSSALLGLGAITLVLALAGIYAMMSLIVSRRTREIGIRIALGATATRVVRTIAGRAATQVLIGGLVGTGLAVLSLKARDGLVSRLGDGGVWTLPLVLVLLVTAGIAATWAPLRRALRVRPQDALKAD